MNVITRYQQFCPLWASIEDKFIHIFFFHNSDQEDDGSQMTLVGLLIGSWLRHCLWWWWWRWWLKWWQQKKVMEPVVCLLTILNRSGYIRNKILCWFWFKFPHVFSLIWQTILIPNLETNQLQPFKNKERKKQFRLFNLENLITWPENDIRTNRVTADPDWSGLGQIYFLESTAWSPSHSFLLSQRSRILDPKPDPDPGPKRDKRRWKQTTGFRTTGSRPRSHGSNRSADTNWSRSSHDLINLFETTFLTFMKVTHKHAGSNWD